MEKINIADLLKECPIGMELDCSMFEDAKIYKIDDSTENEYPIRIEAKNGYLLDLTKYGTYADVEEAKCVIFPKGKTTWEGFQRPFKDGDIVVNAYYVDSNAFIYKGKSDYYYKMYVGLSKGCVPELVKGCNEWVRINNKLRFATEEEKERLFQAIKDNGYKWNQDTKTLEELPKFNAGDICYIKTKEDNEHIFIFKDIKDCLIERYANLFKDILHTNNGSVSAISSTKEFRLATKDEKEKLFRAIKNNGYKWNPITKTFEELPRFNDFKDGDICYIKTAFSKHIFIFKDTDDVDAICNISSVEEFRLATEKEKNEFFQEIKNKGYKWNTITKTWELVSDKFDITTLKPFDKVLVRTSSLDKWHIQFFERYDKNASSRYPFVCMCGNKYGECIPYEGNEHLLNTADNCDKV